MEVICLQDEALYALVDRIVARIKGTDTPKEDTWISGEEVMRLLRITSKTTLQKLRDEGKIRFSQPEKKIILYDLASVHAYLNNNAKSTF